MRFIWLIANCFGHSTHCLHKSQYFQHCTVVVSMSFMKSWLSVKLTLICIADILVSRRGRLVTCSSGNAVRLWSVVNVNEIKHAAQHCGSGSALGVTMEDEMTLDAPVCSASFDSALDMVVNHSSNQSASLSNISSGAESVKKQSGDGGTNSEGQLNLFLI